MERQLSRWDAVAVMAFELVKKSVQLGWTWPNVSFSVAGMTAFVSSFPFVACVLLMALAVRLIRMPEGHMKRVGKKTLTLPTCETHYELLKGSRRELVVIAHGFSGDTTHVRPLAEEVRRRSGCDVLIYDLVGRGYSSCRGGEHTAEIFVSQLAELLYALQVTGKVHCVGVSLGGGVIVEFARYYPTKVASLALIASVGLPLSTSAHVFTKIPLIPDFLFRYALWQTVVAGLEHEWTDPSNPKLHLMVESYKKRVSDEPALGRSLLSTARHFPLESLAHSFQAIRVPLLLVWGDDDRTCPVANAFQIQNMCPHANLQIIHGGRHCVYTEFVADVAHALTLFLNNLIITHESSSSKDYHPSFLSGTAVPPTPEHHQKTTTPTAVVGKQSS